MKYNSPGGDGWHRRRWQNDMVKRTFITSLPVNQDSNLINRVLEYGNRFFPGFGRHTTLNFRVCINSVVELSTLTESSTGARFSNCSITLILPRIPLRLKITYQAGRNVVDDYCIKRWRNEESPGWEHWHDPVRAAACASMKPAGQFEVSQKWGRSYPGATQWLDLQTGKYSGVRSTITDQIQPLPATVTQHHSPVGRTPQVFEQVKLSFRSLQSPRWRWGTCCWSHQQNLESRARRGWNCVWPYWCTDYRLLSLASTIPSPLQSACL